MKRIFAVVVGGMLMAATLGAAPAAASGGGGLVAAPGAVRHGMTYPHWEAAYQVWFEEIPLGMNPQAHPGSPRNCELQPGNTVFVGAAGADCAVPSGASIALSSIFFWECSTAEGLGHSYRALRRCAEENFDQSFGPQVTHTTLRIDGVKVKRPRRWSFTTPGEIVDFPSNNLWDARPGPSKSVTKGLMFIIRPLADGVHHIRLHVNDVEFGICDTDYTLHVG